MRRITVEEISDSVKKGLTSQRLDWRLSRGRDIVIRHFAHGLLACSVASLLAACALPAAGPTALEIERVRTEHKHANFLVVNVDHHNQKFVASHGGHKWPGHFASGSYTPSLALRPGDVISMAIYETGGSFLFGGGAPADPTQAQNRTSTVPSQVVEPGGGITVPFIGRMSVAGLTPQQASRKIEAELGKKTVQPQVVISLISTAQNAASVGGEANKPGIVPLTLRGERLLDAVAFAGGSKYPSTEIDIRLQRRGQNFTVPLQAVISDPALNVAIRPNDEIYLIRNPKTFSVMGASQKVSQYTFDTVKVTLAEAVARAGGIVDTIGNPDGVYLLRTVSAHTVNEIIDATPSAVLDPKTHRPVGKVHVDGMQNVIFRVDMRAAEGYFAAQKIEMRDKDIVLVANAEATQLLKMMTVARAFTGAAYDIRRAGRSD
jgi:polysaccharide biosynthesis/export protein